jgi:hypothetical protein
VFGRESDVTRKRVWRRVIDRPVRDDARVGLVKHAARVVRGR